MHLGPEPRSSVSRVIPNATEKFGLVDVWIIEGQVRSHLLAPKHPLTPERTTLQHQTSIWTLGRETLQVGHAVHADHIGTVRIELRRGRRNGSSHRVGRKLASLRGLRAAVPDWPPSHG